MEMPVSAVSRIVGIDEFSVEKHHVYVTLFYDIRNSRVVDMDEGKESDVFGKFIAKHPFLNPSKIDHITMDLYLMCSLYYLDSYKRE